MATNKKNTSTRPEPLRKVSKRLDLKVGDRIVFNNGSEKMSLILTSHTETQSFTRRADSAAGGKNSEVVLFDAAFESGRVFYAPARKTQKK